MLAPSTLLRILHLGLLTASLGPVSLSRGQAPENPVPAKGSPQIARTPVPDWVVDYVADPTRRPQNQADVGDTYFPLVENQYDVASRTNYYRYLKRLDGESALQDGSQLTFGFDPHYQTLEFHRLRIHRNGTSIDRLAEQEFKVIQREEDHERQLYDDSLSAIAVLEDIRAGDVIEYAFSIRGENPVFDGHFYWTLTTSYSMPVGAIHGVLRQPADLPVKLVQHTTHFAPEVTEAGGTKIHRWILGNPPPLPSEGGLPVDYDPWGWIEATSWLSWGEVATWANKQYVIPKDLPTTLTATAGEIEALESEEERILAALRFAQDEIRYLGIFDGVHSHKPYPLETIVKRRFGDCKDKTLLLVTLLRHLGFEAWPALVGTDHGGAIADWTPSPYAFNHLVTVVRHAGRDHWLDPTNSYQRGPLDALFFPDYGRALVLRGDAGPQTQLDRITPQGFEQTRTRIKETFRLTDYRGKATLEVESSYHGDEADSVRSHFASNARSEIQRKYLNFYSTNYEGIETLRDLEFDDNEETNTVTVREHYAISQIWAENHNNPEKFEAVFPSKYSYDHLGIPSTKNRKMPFALSHPVDLVHEVAIHLPDAMKEKPKKVIIDDPAFRFEYGENFDGPVTRVSYSYKSLADRVAPERIVEYLKNVRKAEDHTDYNLWISRAMLEGKDNSDAAPEYRPNWVVLVTVVMGFLGSAMLCLLASLWKPAWRPREILNPSLIGIGGWLVLVALGTCVQPFFAIGQLVTSITDVDYQTWHNVTDPDGAAYHVLWAPVLLLETAVTAASVPISLYLLVLFFRKHYTFPRYRIVFHGFIVASQALTFALMIPIDHVEKSTMQESGSGLVVEVIRFVVWSLYFTTSVRVANTFRNGLPGPVAPSPPPLPAHLSVPREAGTSPPVSS